MMKEKSCSWIVFMSLAAIITFICVLTGNFFTQKVSIQIGEIAKETYYAPFQVENEVATIRKKQEAVASVEPIYKKDSTVQEKAIGNIDALFDAVETLKNTDIDNKLETLSNRSPIALYNEQYTALLNATYETLNNMKEVCMSITSYLLNEGIISEKSSQVRLLVENTDLSVSMKRIAEDIIQNVLEPNVIIDEVATNEQKKLVQDKVDTVYILAQEKIVEKGARITEESYKLLEKVGYLESNYTVKYKQYIGVLGIILLVGSIFYFYLYKNYITVDHTIAFSQKNKRLSLIFILYGLSLIITRICLKLPFVFLPFGASCMILTLALTPQIAFMTHILTVIFASLVFKGDIVFILYFLISGIISILGMSTIQQRSKTVISGLLIGIVQFVLYITLKLLVGTELTITIFTEGIIAFLVGLLSVVAIIGALPMFESFFEFVTPMQLLEMTNPNQPILKRLLLEATGTYYHSLLVANLAETAATSIEANSLLARVGGYYHDIGKLTCSNYFKENQGSTNPHDYLSPRESYEVIVSHVTAGLKLADEYQLPNYVKDFISQHHGTGITQYFYVQAQKMSDEPIDEKEFAYPGPKPQSKETALVMLADIVEATTRSMQDKLGHEISIEDIVRKSVKQKLDEGQLSECSLYISDLEKIIDSFTKMLTGIYHQRIAYPERNDKN